MLLLKRVGLSVRDYEVSLVFDISADACSQVVRRAWRGKINVYNK